MKNSHPTHSVPERLIRTLRQPVWKKMVSSVLLVQFALWSVRVEGVDYTWDGGSNNWDTSSNFWNTSTVPWVNGFGNNAIFGGTAGTVSLAEAISAGGLTFSSSGYVVTGNTLTLGGTASAASPIISVNNNALGTNQATISSILAGTAGFTKSGNGTLRLTNSGNTFTGDLAIKSGTLVVTDPAALGAGTGPVSITGIAGTGNPGYSGGALLLQGNGTSASGAGMTFSREITMSGRGPGAANATGALVSVGYNTFTGGLTMASGGSETRAFATHGTSTINSDLNLGTGNAQILYGNGNWNVLGQVSGVESSADRFIKTGNTVTTTMWLQNTSNNYAQTLRIDSGTVRVQSNSVLGINTSIQSVDLSNGTIEIRSDNFAGFATRNIAFRDNANSTIFIDHDLTGSLSLGSGAMNQTYTIPTLTRTTGTGGTATLNFNGRNGNGYAVTNTWAAAGNQSTTLANNSSGTVAIVGNINATNNTTARTLTIQGGGDWTVGGLINATGAAHAFTKGNSGTLTFTAGAGTLSSFTGNANLNDGTTEIRSIDLLNNTSTGAGRVVFGGGALNFMGAATTGAGETWTNKILDMNAGNTYILANQTGSSPTALVLPNNFAATNTGAKNLNLGGSAAAAMVNQVNGLIVNNANLTNVIKYGSGTWEIQAPTNYGTAATGVAVTNTSGQSSLTGLASTATLAVGMPVSGTGIPAGATIVQINSGTSITLSVNTTAAATSVNFGAANGSTSNLASTAASTGTANPVITVASTASLVPGQKVTSPNLPAGQNWYIRDITSATTVTLVSGTGASIAAGAVLNGEIITPEDSPNFGGNLTVANGTFRANAATSTSNIINNTSNLIFNTDPVTLMGNAGGTFNYVGFSGGSSTEVLGRLIPTAGHGVVAITNGTGDDTLTFLDIGTRGAGATIDYQPGTGTINFSGTAPAGTNGIQNGYATFNGVDWVTSGATVGQFTGYTAWAGALAPTSTVNYSIAGAASTAAVGTVNSLKVTGGAALTLGGQLSNTTGGVLFDNSTGTASISGSNLGSNNAELIVITNGSSPAVAPSPGASLTTGNALTINSLIGSGSASLTKAGTGTVILTGTSAYTGNTVINQGAIQMSGATAALGGLGTAGNQTAIRQGAILDVNAAGASTALYSGGPSYPQISTGALTGTGIVTNSGGGTGAQSSVSLGGTASTGATTFGGTLQDGAGILNVIINGTSARTQAIIGAQPYTGVTVINTGNLSVTSLANGGTASGLGASSNAGSNLIFNGGTLTYTGAAAAGATTGGGIYQTTQTPSVSTDRLFSLAGNAAIQSSGTFGNEAASAGTGNNNAALVWSNTGDVGFVTSGAKTLTLGGTSIGDNRFRPRLTDNTIGGAASALTVNGGLWIIDPLVANTYTGATSVTGGQLRAVDGVGIPTASNLTLNGGVYEVAGSSTFGRTLGTAAGNVQLSNASGFANAGTNRLVVSLSGGAALTWGSGGFAPTSFILGSSTSLGETEFTNSINLGTSARTITVNNNGNTGAMVTAGILSGVISGGAGGNLTKNGGGVLMLGNANTYVGNTQVDNGTIVATSIGTGVSSSLGASGTFIANNPGNADLSPLIYVGTGETANRNLTLQGGNFTGNRTIRFDASGSGALVWNIGTFANTTRGDSVSRVVVLELRGSNVDNNQMNLVLTNSTNGTNPNTLNVTKTDGGTWILNPASANTFTGGITVAQGNLGLTTNGIGANTAISVNNGSVFAFGGPLTTSAILQGNNSTAVISGQNSMTFGGLNKTAGNNSWNLSNNLEGGALLTINNGFTNAENGGTAATQTLSIRGYGSTVINGAITENAAAGGKIALNIAIHPNATFTTSGTANTYTGGTTLTDGILILDKATGGLGASTGTFNFNGGTLRVGATPTDLTGANAIANPVTIGASPPKVDGSKSIQFSGVVAMAASRNLQNEMTGGAQLILSGGIAPTASSTLTLFGAGNTLISGAYGAGTGTNALTMSGTGQLSLTALNAATGVLTVNRGTTTMSGANGAWSAGTFALNLGGTLTLDNSGTNNNNRMFDTGGITFAGGTLNLIGNTTTEVAGALTINGTDAIINMSGTGTNTLTFASANFAASGSSLNLSGVSGTNSVIFTTAPALTNGIHPRIFLGGGDFATHGGNNTAITAFTGYAAGTDINSGATTDTYKITSSYTVDDLTASRTMNALSISDTSARNISAVGNSLLTVTSGAIIANGGVTHTLSVPRMNLGGATIQTTTGTTLDITGTVSVGTTLTKALPGTLQLSAKQWFNSTINVNEGALILNGGDNTLLPGFGTLNVDANSSVDLKGSVQYVLSLGSAGLLPGTGGTVSTSVNGGLLVSGGTASTWAGTISGTNLNFARTGGNVTMVLQQAQTYTGTTTLMGGILALENDATILNTSAIDINYAALSLNNNSSLQTQINNRISDTAPITLRGGTLTYNGRLSAFATESFNTLTLDQGSSIVTANTGAGTFTSVDITFASLTRNNNSTINFTGTSLGQQGNNARIFFATPIPTTNGGVIGAWAVANSTDYAAYNTALGVGIVGQGGFAGYDPVFGTGKLTQIPATTALVTTLPAGTTNAAILRLAGGVTNDIAFTSASDTLNLELGGLLRSDNNVASTIGTTAIRGVLTSGISELISYNNQNTLTINSVIAGATRYIKDGAGTVTLTAPNTYTLGTTVNRGTLNISPTTAGDVVIPNSVNGLVINGGGQNAGSTANLTVSNAIGSSNDLTVNGRGALTMSASVVQTLNKVTLNNNGGDVGPTITINNTGGVLSLTNATPITATSSNASTTATITGGMLALGAGAKTFDIAPITLGSQVYTTIAPTLSIASAITGTGPINKVGTGLLALSGASTFTGLNVNVGGVIVGANSTNSSGTVISGPLGIGQVAMAAGTSIFTSGNFSVGNDVSFAGTPTFNSTATTAWTLSLTGNLTGAGLSGGTPTIEVTNPGMTVALLGNLPAASSYTKTGLGTLIFNATNYTGDFNATALGNPNAISLIHDGDRTGSVQTIAMGNVIFDAGILPNITLNRGGSLPFPLAANKILAPASISNLSGGLTVNVNAGYGLKVSDNITFAGLPAITVTGTQASNVTQGLYLAGNLTGIGFVKTGSGSMVIDNPVPTNNTFTGNININQGVVSVSSDAQLGSAANLVLLNPQTGTATFRATSSFATSRVIQLSNTTSGRAIEVTSGNTLTLNTAFNLNSGAGAAASLLKADLGTLELAAANTGWSGTFTINAGAVSTSLASALGTGTLVVNEASAALQLNGGITVANPITLDVLANGRAVTGINTGGAIQSVTGDNIISGTITANAGHTSDNQTRSFGLGADSGASLSFGNLNFSHASGGTGRNVIIYLGGAGNLTLTGVIDNTNGSPGSSFIFKHGSGNMTVTAANAIPDTETRIYRGGMTLNGAGTFGTGGTQIQVWQNGTLTLDNSTTNTANRFSTNRQLNVGGGTVVFTPNSSGSSHVSTGVMTISQGGSTLNLGAGGNQTVTFGSLSQGAGATLNLTGTFGTANNKLTFTTPPTLVPATTGILARVTTNGDEFATYSATNGVTTFTGYSPATNILTATATQTFRATTSTLNSLTGNQTLNALTINNTASVGGLGGNPPATLTLTSGGLLANGSGGAFLNVPIVAFGGVEAVIHVQSGQSLTVNSGMSGTAGLTKSLNGTLNLNTQQFVSGNTIVNSGTLNLQSGAVNTLLFNNGLGVNSGGTVDLQNGAQFIGSLFSANAGGNTDLGGGTVTNSGAQATLVTNSNSSFNGRITGTIFLNKTGTNSLNLQAANAYSGPTLITGGTLTLQDDGSILNTTAIGINYGTLSVSNTALRDNANRISDTAPITMYGGTLNFQGRAQANSSETVGAVTLVEGNNSIFSNDADIGIGSGVLTIASLNRTGATSTLRFNNAGNFGLIGTQGRVMITANPTLTNNIIGPWAVVDREFASYDANYGVGTLLQTGFAGHSAVGLNGNPTSSDNVRLAVAGTTTLLNDTTVGTLSFGQQGTTTLDLGGKKLTIQGGGLILNNATDSTNYAITNGTLTGPSGGGDLFIHHLNYSGTNRTASIDAAITDNGGPVRVIKNSGDTGPSVMTWNGTNTYTGGTVLNMGTLTLGAASTLGTGGITVYQAALTQTAGAIIPAQQLTMNGPGTVTLAGSNTLTGITFNNMGGGTPTINPTGTLTLTGGITTTSVNAGSISTISNGTLNLNAAGSFPINVGAAMVNGINIAPWQAGLIINSVIDNGGISKSGAGLLQLGGQSTFTGGVNVTAGGLVIGASSNPSTLGDPIVTGPLGTGTVTMAANTTLVSTAANTVSNDFVFLGDTVFNGIQNLTLNGNTTLPSIWNATVTAPQMTVTIGNVINSLSSDQVNKSGLGTLILGNYNGTINIAGGLIFLADGNGLGTVENIALGGNVALTADTAITVNRSGASPNARNKTVQKVNLTNNGSILAVNNQNGFGLEFTGTTSLTGASHFSVGTASASNVVQGLTLSGVVSDTAGFDLVKSGLGTLALTNSGNTFGGVGKTIDVLNGILSANSDGALGNSGNSVSLQVDGTTGVGFRATGPSWSTSRTFNLNALNNAIEVTAGTVFTLNTAFGLSAVSNTLTKNDNGVFEINADNSTWTGGITINAGAVRLSNANAAGSGTISISPNVAATGAALQLSGGISLSNPISLQGNGNVALGGINFGGQLESFSGNNTVTGAVLMNFDAAIGAASGATLNINGGINNPTTTGRALVFTGAGTINLNSNVTSSTTTANQYFSMRKFGAGSLNITSALSIIPTDTATGLQVHAGTMALSGAGTITGGNTISLQVLPGATLTLDNAVTNAANRLGGRPVTLTGGNVNLIGNTAVNTAESLGAPQLARGLSVITVTAQPGFQADLTFTGSANNPSSAQNSTSGGPTGASILFRGTSLGSPAGAGVATIKNTGTGTLNGFSFAGQTGAAGSATKAIMPYALVDNTVGGSGISFATADNVNAIVRPLATTEYAASNTFVANNNINLTTGTTSIGAATLNVNSLTIAGNAGVTIPAFQQLTSSSGGILVKSGSTSAISGGIINQAAGASPLNVWTLGDLTISSLLTGGNGTTSGAVGFVKAGAGTLTLTTPVSNISGLTTSVNTYSGQLVINQGTLKLNGGKNTIQANNFLAINGGTLDLNGNSQQTLSLFTDGSVDGAGGIVTSSTGTGNLVVNQDNAARNWAGSIQGSVNFTRSGQNTLTIYSPQSYTGTTVINAGTTTFRDNASLLGTTAISLGYATVNFDNNAGALNLTDRINDSASIEMRGATLNIAGRAQTASSETIGNVSIVEGFNVINPSVGGTGINSNDLTVASLSRPVGSSAIFFANGTNLGTIGSNSRIMVGSINGVATTNPTYSANGSGLTNNIVGGWAITNNEFLTYIPGLGLAPLNQAGAAQYDLNNTFVGADPTANVRLTATTNLAAAVTNVNALSLSGTSLNLTFGAATNLLNITSGGLIGTNNNNTIGATVDSGRLTAGGLTPGALSDLYLYNRTNTMTINARIVDNTSGGTSRVRAVFSASGGAFSLVNPNASYTGGTVLNGGTLNLNNTSATPVIPAADTPADGLVINGGTVTMNNFAGQIAASNTVTLNGGSTLNLWGNNTLNGLIFNNKGGTGNPAVLTYSTAAAAGAAANGVLTIGSGGIVATSSNVGTTNLIEGRVDFGTSLNSISVDTINVNGTNDVVPLQAGLLLRGVVGTSGGFSKIGNGVLGLAAQMHYAGPTNVDAGGIRISAVNGGSRFSSYTLAAGTRLDLAGSSTQLGSIAGAGTIFNSGGAATLQTGFDNMDTTFSGQFSRFNDATAANLVLQKIGTGTLTLTGAQSTSNGTTAAFTVNGGSLAFSGAGAWFTGTTTPAFAGTFTVNNGGKISLDNATSNLNSRLGLNLTGTFNLQGGTLAISGNSALATTEGITTFNVTNGGGRVELNADPARALTLAITTLSAANPTGALVIAGITGAASGPGVANVTITTPSLIGSQGAGANGSVTMPVRHDILADASVSGLGTGFLVRDSVTSNYRALAASELASAIALPLTTDVDAVTAGNQGAGLLNVGLVGTTQSLTVNSVANTLTISGTSTVNSGLDAAFGVYGPGGNLLGLTLSQAAASLTLAGATGNINVGNFGSTSAGTTIYSHVIAGGTLNVNSYFGVGNTGGFHKAQGGTLTLNKAAFYTGGTNVSNGTLSLNSGAANTIAVVPGASTPGLSALAINGTGAVVNLNGFDQVVGTLSSVNPIPGNSGSVTSSTPAMFTTVTQAASGVFGGTIDGALSFTRAGANTTTLTNASTYTGSTVLRGGSLQLRDSGSILNTSSITSHYGTLLIDNQGLNANGTPNPTRISASAPVTLAGATVTLNSAASTDNTLVMNSVTVTGGNNTINVLPYINGGSTAKIIIGNLVRNANTRSGVNFNGFSQLNGGNGSSTLGGQGFSVNGNIILNQINGTNFTAANLVNNLIGGWAVADGNTFATYVNGFGVSVMGQTTGGIVAPGFDGTDISAATTATQNINDGTAARTITGVHVANSWRSAAGATQTVDLATASSLSLGVGLITNGNVAITLRGADATSVLTSPNADLFIYVNQNTTSINTKITGNLALIRNGGATLSLGSPTNAAGSSNDYTGGTFINGGTTNLNGAAGMTIIPAGPAGAGLVITNATVAQATNNQQIAPTTDVVLRGNANLNLTVGTNTLNSLTWDNQGGNGNPTVNGGAGLLTLTAANAITANNDSFATTPVLSGAGGLALSNSSPIISVDGLSVNGLQISAVISSAGGPITKNGMGALTLTGASTFTTGFNLNQGSLIFGVGSTGAVTNGPVGTGTLTVEGATSILSDGTVRTVANATTINGDFTFGGVIVGNGVILSGAMNLGASERVLTVTSPAVTSTISGAITSTATGTALTKAGAGTLVLSNASSNFAGAGVAVTGGMLKVGVNNGIPVSSALAISAGAGFDLNNFDQTIDGLNGAGFVTNSANATKTLTISSTSTNSSFSGVLTDNILGAANSRLNVTKAGAGTTQALTHAASTYSGITNITGGALEVSKLDNGGVASSIGRSSNVATNLVINGADAALRYVGNGDSTDRSFTVGTAGAALESSGTGGALVWNGTATVTGAGARTFALGGSNTAANTFTTAVTNGAGTISLAKSGAGTWVLPANNTYTGTTTVNGGVLQVGTTAITTAALNGGGAVTVNAGATLTGTGTVTGAVTVQGTGTNIAVLTPGDNSGATNARLNLGSSLSIGANGQLQFQVTTATYNEAGNLGGYLNALAFITDGANSSQVPLWNAVPTLGNSDFIDVAGGLTINTSANPGTIGTVRIIDNGYVPAYGDVFNLIDWVGAMGGGFNAGTGFTSGGILGDFDLPMLSGGFAWDTSAFVQYGVVVVVPEPGRALLMLLGLMALFFRRRRRD